MQNSFGVPMVTDNVRASFTLSCAGLPNQAEKNYLILKILTVHNPVPISIANIKIKYTSADMFRPYLSLICQPEFKDRHFIMPNLFVVNIFQNMTTLVWYCSNPKHEIALLRCSERDQLREHSIIYKKVNLLYSFAQKWHCATNVLLLLNRR